MEQNCALPSLHLQSLPLGFQLIVVNSSHKFFKMQTIENNTLPLCKRWSMSEYAHGEPQHKKVFIPHETFQLHLFATFLCQEQSIKPSTLHYCLSFLILPLFHSGKKKQKKKKIEEIKVIDYQEKKKERNHHCEGRTLEPRGFCFKLQWVFFVQINNIT